MKKAQRGAALIYALIAIIIISLLTLAIGRLMGSHARLEQQMQGYARAIYVAEAAANWQLNRMSRSALPGTSAGAIPGRLNYEDVSTWRNGQSVPYSGPLPATELGANFTGRADVWVKSSAQGGAWTPPQSFILWAVGYYSENNQSDEIKRRGIEFIGTGTGLSEPYALFGRNELRFEGGSLANPVETCTLQKGYIGSNKMVSFQRGNNPPVGLAPSGNSGGMFFGCRLAGPEARLSPKSGNWTAGWDIPRLPEAVVWPTISDVLLYQSKGTPVSQLETSNSNSHIDIQMASGVWAPLRQANGQSVEKLEDAEFGRSPTRTIRLQAEADQVGETGEKLNLFVFKSIRMGPDDKLVLDLRKYYGSTTSPQAHAIRILMTDDGVHTEDFKITNLAYYVDLNPPQTVGDRTPNRQAYIWLNNSGRTFVYAPTLAERALDAISVIDPEQGSYRFDIKPELRGLVYGVNNIINIVNLTNIAGSVVVQGNNALGSPGVKVNAIVANRITIRGRVTVDSNPVEDEEDPRRYVLYYRVRRRPVGEMDPSFNAQNTGVALPRLPEYNYGPLP